MISFTFLLFGLSLVGAQPSELDWVLDLEAESEAGGWGYNNNGTACAVPATGHYDAGRNWNLRSGYYYNLEKWGSGSPYSDGSGGNGGYLNFDVNDWWWRLPCPILHRCYYYDRVPSRKGNQLEQCWDHSMTQEPPVCGWCVGKKCETECPVGYDCSVPITKSSMSMIPCSVYQDCKDGGEKTKYEDMCVKIEQTRAKDCVRKNANYVRVLLIRAHDAQEAYEKGEQELLSTQHKKAKQIKMLKTIDRLEYDSLERTDKIKANRAVLGYMGQVNDLYGVWKGIFNDELETSYKAYAQCLTQYGQLSWWDNQPITTWQNQRWRRGTYQNHRGSFTVWGNNQCWKRKRDKYDVSEYDPAGDCMDSCVSFFQNLYASGGGDLADYTSKLNILTNLYQHPTVKLAICDFANARVKDTQWITTMKNVWENAKNLVD